MAKRNNNKQDKDKSFREEKDYQNQKRGGNPRYKNKANRSSKAADSNRPSFERGYSNDPNWWMKAGQLSKDAARFSTFNALGAPGPNISATSGPYTPAGIARFDYIPYFGDVDSVVHPMNVAAKLMYDTINSKNSRNPSYDPSDLMIFVIAVAQAWTLHSVVQRIVGMYNTFSPTNRYWWVPVANSMGISALTVQHSVVEWRNLANLMSLKLNMLSVPNQIAYYARSVMLPSAFYADDKTSKASLYYFMPAALFKYGYDSESKGQLTLSSCPWWNSTNVTPATVESYFNGLTQNLFNDSDVNTMCADIIKAYGIENCFRLPQMSDDYTLSFVLDPVVNSQLHNSRIFYNAMPKAVDATNGYKLSQDMISNSLTTNSWKPDLTTDSPSLIYFGNEAINASIPLDFYTDDPSEIDFTEATRLTCFVQNGQYIGGCTEMLVKDRYWVFEETSGGQWSLRPYEDLVINGVKQDVNSKITNTDFRAYIHEEAIFSKFHDAPLHWTVLADSTNGYILPKLVELSSDLCNYTTITRDELAALTRACQLSVFSPIDMG